MKVFLFICSFLFVQFANGANFDTLEKVKSYVHHSEQTVAVKDLLKRILGKRSEEIKIEILPEPYDQDYAFVSYVFLLEALSF